MPMRCENGYMVWWRGQLNIHKVYARWECPCTVDVRWERPCEVDARCTSHLVRFFTPWYFVISRVQCIKTHICEEILCPSGYFYFSLACFSGTRRQIKLSLTCSFPDFLFKSSRDPTLPDLANINYAANKTDLVLWYVSNCDAKRTHARITYSRELSKYIHINIYGGCTKVNAKPDPCYKEKNCEIEVLSKHKFYLSFENSRCHWWEFFFQCTLRIRTLKWLSFLCLHVSDWKIGNRSK